MTSDNLLLEKIDGVRRRWKSVQVGAGACKCLLAALALVAGFFILDWLVLSRSVESSSGDRVARGVLLAAMLATFAWVVWREVWSELRRVRDDDEIALRVEQGHPELRGRLISTVQLTRDRSAHHGSQELITALAEDTVGASRAIAFTDIINVTVLKKSLLVALGFALLAAALGAWRSDYASALFARLALAESEYPTKARIRSLTPSGTAPHGEPYEVLLVLDAAGHLPETATLEARPSRGGESVSYVFSRDPGADTEGRAMYRAKLERVLEDLDYRALAYDARSKGWEKLRVLRRPAIKSLLCTYAFPEYLGRPAEQSSVGDIRAPEGAVVSISVTLNKAVRTASLQQRFSDSLPEPLPMALNADGTVASLDLPIERNGYYRILLHCVDGMQNINPIDYAVLAVKDRAPQVKITFPAQDKNVTPFAQWPVRFEVRDDNGIAKGRLNYRIAPAPGLGVAPSDDLGFDAPVRSLELDGLVTAARQRDATGEVVFDLEPLGLKPGQRVTYWIEADDARVPKANSAQSQQFVFTIGEVAEIQGTLDRDRKDALQTIDTIRDKEKENRDGVDAIRLRLDAAPAPKAP